MIDFIPVFVNDRAVRVPPGGTVADAVAALDPALAGALAAGSAQVTDGRGIALDPGTPVYSGAIVRVFLSARKGGGEPDAHS